MAAASSVSVTSRALALEVLVDGVRVVVDGARRTAAIDRVDILKIVVRSYLKTNEYKIIQK